MEGSLFGKKLTKIVHVATIMSPLIFSNTTLQAREKEPQFSNPKIRIEGIEYVKQELKDKEILFNLAKQLLVREKTKAHKKQKYEIKITKDEIKEKVKSLITLIQCYDKGRQWVLDNNFDTNPARTKLVKRDNPILTMDIEKSYKKASTGNNVAKGINAFYNPSVENIYFRLDIESQSAVQAAIHEYNHMLRKATKFFPKETIKLFSEAFDSSSALINLNKIYRDSSFQDNTAILKKITYLANPLEISAMVKVFIYDLERLGIKKPGEKFTEDHYLEALQLSEAGKFSNDSRILFLIIKPTHFVKIMNLKY